MSCGFKQFANGKNKYIFKEVFSQAYKTEWLYTAYLGRVKVKVGISNKIGFVNMECKGVGVDPNIIVRELDASVCRIDPNINSSLQQLSFKPPAELNINENKENYYLIQRLELFKANQTKDEAGIKLRQSNLNVFKSIEQELYDTLEKKYRLLTYSEDKLSVLYVKNSVVDIHFNTTMYLEFLQKKLNRQSVNNSSLLISVFNVQNLDNAFFTGEFMVYGNGKTYFYPLTSIDVGGHELGHGIVQATAGLEYSAESGALNESFADIFGTAFEFYIYERFNNDDDKSNDIQGESDWLIGEDIGKQIKYLRDMKNPTTARQPKKYGGEFWVDTKDTSENNDYGGVHTNSGVGNHCFYLASQELSIDTVLPIFYNCLLKLNRNSSYQEFGKSLLESTPELHKGKIQKCLLEVGILQSEDKDTGIEYPNSNIPFIPNLCCPHCLCLQKKKNIDIRNELPRRSKRLRH